MALLELANDLRDLLRVEGVTTVAGSAPDLRVQIALLNRAARKVLARRPWSFLHRDDGYLFFPASTTGTNLLWAGGGAVQVSLLDLPTAQARLFAGTSVVAMVLAETSDKPATSYRVSDIDVSGFPLATVPIPFQGTALASYAYTLYTNTAALPASVAQVLSIRNEEGVAIRFETMDTFDDFDRLVPQDAERFDAEPDIVAVGGHTIATSITEAGVTTAGTKGVAVRIYPAASANIVLRYSYIWRPDDLATDADEWTGVPAEVEDLIVRTAFEEALRSNIEDDPRRADTQRVSNELSSTELFAQDRRDLGRRLIPRPFHAGRMPVEPRLRGEVPEP